MISKLNPWLFYSLILIQLQLDLLLFNLGLQSLICTLLFLFIYPKKAFWFKNSVVLIAFIISKFITASRLMGLELALIILIWLICQILKRNIIFKNLIFYVMLVFYLFLNNWLATKYVFKVIFTPKLFLLSTILNIAVGTVIIKIFNNLLENQN